jgi:uncharacterized protein YbjT (DUF2867 family)
METVVIAGASGFVGKALAIALRGKYRLIGLTRDLSRSKGRPQDDNEMEWRHCDLFSLQDAEAALKGADYAFYLVHSMMPSAKLTQGSFRDMDLIVADNFARATQRNQVKQVVYLGGLVPRNQALSQHLASRLEVEQTLLASTTPVTALRAGMILGPGGSSFLIMSRLVERLPFMLVPRWTLNQSSPIALTDIVRFLTFCLGNPLTFNQIYDVAGAETLTYKQMLALTAQFLKVKRWMLPFPLFTTKLSRLWVELITGAPRSLVRPLVESLKSPMVASDSRLQEMAGIHPLSFQESLAEAYAHKNAPKPVSFNARPPDEINTVRSVQRLPMPTGATVDWAADLYLKWLPRWIPYVIRVDIAPDGHCTFVFKPFGIKLLTLYLNRDRSHSELRVFEIGEGVLVKSGLNGHLEFRRALGQNCILSAIHDYQPRLPWLLYTMTQARAHKWVMKSFGRFLKSSRVTPEKVVA